MCIKKTVLCVSGLLIIGMGITICWASLKENMFQLPEVVLKDPWFWTSIADVYAGMALFYLWVFYKEKNWAGRLIWLVVFAGLGNIATAFYLFITAYKLPDEPDVKELLLRGEHA